MVCLVIFITFQSYSYTYVIYGVSPTFLSRCLSRRVRASVSPPGHTAEDRPSVSKPVPAKASTVTLFTGKLLNKDSWTDFYDV